MLSNTLSRQPTKIPRLEVDRWMRFTSPCTDRDSYEVLKRTCLATSFLSTSHQCTCTHHTPHAHHHTRDNTNHARATFWRLYRVHPPSSLLSRRPSLYLQIVELVAVAAAAAAVYSGGDGGRGGGMGDGLNGNGFGGGGNNRTSSLQRRCRLCRLCRLYRRRITYVRQSPDLARAQYCRRHHEHESAPSTWRCYAHGTHPHT